MDTLKIRTARGVDKKRRSELPKRVACDVLVAVRIDEELPCQRRKTKRERAERKYG